MKFNNDGMIVIGDLVLDRDTAYYATMNTSSNMINMPGYSHPKVAIYDQEGSIPHFHIYDKNPKTTPPKLDVAIKVHINQYFNHGSHQGVLSDTKQRRFLNAWLHQKNHEMPELTNWQRMVYEWNKTPYTGKLLFPNGFIQPEYFKILPRDDSVDSKLLIPCR